MMSLRVLHVSYDGLLEPLGEAQLVPYAEGLARRGFGIGVFSFEKPGDLADRSRCDAMASRLSAGGIAWRTRRYHKWPTAPATLVDVAVGAGEILRWSRRCPAPRLLHLRGYVPGLMALLGGRLSGTKLLFDTRSFMVDERIECGMWAARSVVARAARAVEQRLLATADAMTVVSRVGARRLPALAGGAVPTKVRVIRPCVDLERFRPVENQAALKAELGLQPGPVIVHSGALSSWYLAEYTFQVGSEFAKRSGGSFLVLTHETEFARSLNTRLGGEAIIRSVEHSDMPRWLGACDAGLAVVRPDPAKQGGSPVKLGEYLACGLASAVTHCVGDVKEDLAGARTALAFDPTTEPPAVVAAWLLGAAASQVGRRSRVPSPSASIRWTTGASIRRPVPRARCAHEWDFVARKLTHCHCRNELMCGIAGEVSWSGIDRAAAIRMAERLHHRGPDRRSTYVSPTGRCALAHARLRIIDLETGEQPMSNEDGSVWVVFNGEIYNFRELRARARGARPRFRIAQRHRGHRPRLRGVGRRRASSASTACSPWRSGTSGASACCSPATAPARSRSTSIATSGRLSLRLGDQGASSSIRRADGRSTRARCPST